MHKYISIWVAFLVLGQGLCVECNAHTNTLAVSPGAPHLLEYLKKNTPSTQNTMDTEGEIILQTLNTLNKTTPIKELTDSLKDMMSHIDKTGLFSKLSEDNIPNKANDIHGDSVTFKYNKATDGAVTIIQNERLTFTIRKSDVLSITAANKKQTVRFVYDPKSTSEPFRYAYDNNKSNIHVSLTTVDQTCQASQHMTLSITHLFQMIYKNMYLDVVQDFLSKIFPDGFPSDLIDLLLGYLPDVDTESLDFLLSTHIIPDLLHRFGIDEKITNTLLEKGGMDPYQTVRYILMHMRAKMLFDITVSEHSPEKKKIWIALFPFLSDKDMKDVFHKMQLTSAECIQLVASLTTKKSVMLLKYLWDAYPKCKLPRERETLGFNKKETEAYIAEIFGIIDLVSKLEPKTYPPSLIKIFQILKDTSLSSWGQNSTTYNMSVCAWIGTLLDRGTIMDDSLKAMPEILFPVYDLLDPRKSCKQEMNTFSRIVAHLETPQKNSLIAHLIECLKGRILRKRIGILGLTAIFSELDMKQCIQLTEALGLTAIFSELDIKQCIQLTEALVQHPSNPGLDSVIDENTGTLELLSVVIGNLKENKQQQIAIQWIAGIIEHNQLLRDRMDFVSAIVSKLTPHSRNIMMQHVMALAAKNTSFLRLFPVIAIVTSHLSQQQLKVWAPQLVQLMQTSNDVTKKTHIAKGLCLVFHDLAINRQKKFLSELTGLLEAYRASDSDEIKIIIPVLHKAISPEDMMRYVKKWTKFSFLDNAFCNALMLLIPHILSKTPPTQQMKIVMGKIIIGTEYNLQKSFNTLFVQLKSDQKNIIFGWLLEWIMSGYDDEKLAAIKLFTSIASHVDPMKRKKFVDKIVGILRKTTPFPPQKQQAVTPALLTRMPPFVFKKNWLKTWAIIESPSTPFTLQKGMPQTITWAPNFCSPQILDRAVRL